VKIRLSADTYRKFCVILAVAFFGSNFASYSEKWQFHPKYWVGLLAAITAPLLVMALFTRRMPIRPLMVWCGGFLLVSIIWFFPSKQDAIAYQEVQTHVLSVIFLLIILFLCSRPAEQHLARVMIALTVVFHVGLCFYEVIHPLTFSKIPGRSSSLFENANQTGSALMLGMIVSNAVVPSRLRLPFVVLTGLGIVTTFTRAAMLGWVLVALLLAFRAGIGVRQVRGALIFGAVVVGFVFSPYWGDLHQTLIEKGVLDTENLQRLAFFSTGSTPDASAADRKGVLEAGWRMFEEKPLTGWGTGTFRVIPGFDLSTHDIYVANLIDFGILGLFIVPSLLLATIWGANWKTFDVVGPFVLFVTMWGFFSHNVLEERHILLPAALVASMVTSARTRRVEAESPDLASSPIGALAHA
jgi:O-antigen ligase